MKVRHITTKHAERLYAIKRNDWRFRRAMAAAGAKPHAIDCAMRQMEFHAKATERHRLAKTPPDDFRLARRFSRRVYARQDPEELRRRGETKRAFIESAIKRIARSLRSPNYRRLYGLRKLR